MVVRERKVQSGQGFFGFCPTTGLTTGSATSRQQDSNFLSPSLRQLHLFKLRIGERNKFSVPVVSFSVVGQLTLPTFLTKIRLRKVSRIAERLPTFDNIVHNVVYLSQFPLLRLVILMPQCFSVKLFGADRISFVAVQIIKYLSGLSTFMLGVRSL